MMSPSLAWMSVPEANYVRPQLDLRLAGYTFKGASVEHSRAGTNYACTIGPVSDETMAALDRAATNRGTICLLFPQPLLLDLVTVERKASQRVRIAGRIVGDIHHGGERHI